MRKTALFLALLLVAASLLISCNNGGKQNTDEPAVESDVIIAKDGKCEYTVVYPDKHTQAEREAAIYIRNALRDFSGAAVNLTTDWTKDEKTSDVKEILVGNTNREESPNESGYDYRVEVLGNKIVVNGKDDNSLYYAVGALVSRYIKNSENSVVKVPKELKIDENVESAQGWMLYAMPVMENVVFGEHSKSVTTAFDSSSAQNGNEYATVQYFSDVLLSEFEDYVEKLESYGFVVDSRTSHEKRHVVSLYRAVAGRQHRYCITLTEAELSLSISQIVPYDAQ